MHNNFVFLQMFILGSQKNSNYNYTDQEKKFGGLSSQLSQAGEKIGKEGQYFGNNLILGTGKYIYKGAKEACEYAYDGLQVAATYAEEGYTNVVKPNMEKGYNNYLKPGIKQGIKNVKKDIKNGVHNFVSPIIQAGSKYTEDMINNGIDFILEKDDSQILELSENPQQLNKEFIPYDYQQNITSQQQLDHDFQKQYITQPQQLNQEFINQDIKQFQFINQNLHEIQPKKEKIKRKIFTNDFQQGITKQQQIHENYNQFQFINPNLKQYQQQEFAIAEIKQNINKNKQRINNFQPESNQIGNEGELPIIKTNYFKRRNKTVLNGLASEMIDMIKNKPSIPTSKKEANSRTCTFCAGDNTNYFGGNEFGGQGNWSCVKIGRNKTIQNNTYHQDEGEILITQEELKKKGDNNDFYKNPFSQDKQTGHSKQEIELSKTNYNVLSGKNVNYLGGNKIKGDYNLTIIEFGDNLTIQNNNYNYKQKQEQNQQNHHLDELNQKK